MIELSNDAEKKHTFLREVHKESLELVCETVGFSDINNPFHQSLINEIELEEKDRLYLLPRGHLKSSLITIAETIRQVIKNPDIRIGIASHTGNVAKAFLKEIREILQANEHLKMLFPEIFYDDPERQAKRWTWDSLQMKRRSQHKEPTIFAFGIDALPVGYHFDILIYDDPVTAKTCNTVDQIRKTKDQFKHTTPLLNKNGRRLVVGTRYDYDDLYGDLEKIEKYQVLKTSCFNQKGEPIFPNHFDKAKLKELEDDLGDYIFSCQYLLEPVSNEAADFKREWIQYYDTWPDWPMYYFLSIDPAISKRAGSDYTGITLVTMDEPGDLYIKIAEQKKLNPSELIDLIFELHEEYPIEVTSIEAISYQRSLGHFLKKEMISRGKVIHIQEITSRPNSKETRIRGLVPYFSQGRIYLSKDMPDLEQQLFRFPRSRHDDIIDALADIPHIAYAPQDDESDMTDWERNADYHRRKSVNEFTGY